MNDFGPAPDRPLPWLKLWHSFLDSPKIQGVTEALRARYVNLLCVACKFGLNGKLPDLAKVAFMIRLSEDDAQETLEKLIEAGMIERRGKSYWIHDWDQWQHKKSKAAEKQQRYRDNVKTLRNADGNALPTRDVTDRNVLPRVREELDKEKEKDKEPPSKPPRGGGPPFVLPDWIPENDWNDYIAMRKTIRKPATERAKQLIVMKLDRLRRDGNDPVEVLQQSIMSCHQSVWPMAIPFNNHKNGAPAASKSAPTITPEEEAAINARRTKRLNY